MMRHAIYFGLSIILLLFVPGSLWFVIPFMVFAHVYKGSRGLICRSKQQSSNVDDDASLKDTRHSVHVEGGDGEAEDEEEEIPV